MAVVAKPGLYEGLVTLALKLKAALLPWQTRLFLSAVGLARSRSLIGSAPQA